jgi:hypothetical protein
LSTSNSFLLHKNKSSLDNKETGNGIIVDYYEAVRIAYQNSGDVREYFNCSTIEDINKDLQIIWKFTYRILYFEKGIKVVSKDVAADNLLVSWIM